MKLIRSILIISILFQITACAGFNPSRNVGNYDIEFIPLREKEWALIKYNKITGESWVVWNDTFIEILDDPQLPESFYKLKLLKTNNNNHWYILKLDTVSGKSWFYDNHHWKPIEAGSIEKFMNNIEFRY